MVQTELSHHIYHLLTLPIQPDALALPQMLETLDDFLSRRLPLGKVSRLEQNKELVWVEVEHLELLEVLGPVSSIKHDAQFIESVQICILLGVNLQYTHQWKNLFATEVDLLESNVAEDVTIEGPILRGVTLVNDVSLIELF